ncbi:MAG TPA: MFS transporter [Fimbriimonas sp.]|nr:MFS transporter [Fimbriimonas sp.]
MLRWRIEAPLLVALLLDLLGFGMIIADFQLRAEKLMPAGWPTGAVIGGLLASTFVTQVIVSPRWGVASDRLGRKLVIVACTALSAAAMFVFAGAQGVLWLLVSRILAGLGGANVAIGQAIISDHLEDEHRAAALGRIGAAISAGLILGPVLGGVLAVVGANHLVGLVAGALSTVAALLLAIFLPSTKPTGHTEIGKTPIIDLRLIRDYPRLRALVLIAAVSWFSLAMLEGTFARLLKDLFNYDQRHFGALFGYESLIAVVVQGVFLGWISKRVKETPLLRTAYILQGLGLGLTPAAVFVQPLVMPLAALFVASTFFALGSALANPTVNSACSHLAPKERQGELFGVLQSARSVGFLAGPLLGGILFDFKSWLPYVIAAGVCAVAAFLVPSSKSESATAP